VKQVRVSYAGGVALGHRNTSSAVCLKAANLLGVNMKTVLITGTNRGIGLELCRQLKAAGWNVIAVCRTASQALKDLGVEIVEGIDVSQDAAIPKLKEELGEGRTLSAVINNAGLLEGMAWDQLDFESIARQFQINAVGPLRVMQAVQGMLTQGSKVLMMTSRMGSIADNTSGGSYGYRMSKTALTMAAVSLAHDLKEQGIAIGIIHPGYVRTDMTHHTGHMDPQESVEGILARLDQLNLENSGTFWHANGEVLPW